MPRQPQVEAFFDPATSTVSYVVYDRPGGHAAIVDPVLDYEPRAARIGHASAERLIGFVRQHGLTLDWILETHAHADHLSAAAHIQRQLGGRIAIGERIREVQATFGPLFGLGADFASDGRPFDHLFADGEAFRIGALEAQALSVPGHTPADLAYRIGDAVFVGDTLFMPDLGTARCDFPGGDAATLYRSIGRLLALPPETRLYLCHDYPPAGRAACWQTTVAEQRRTNVHVRDGIDEARFVALRQARDRGLELPALMLPAVQVNIRAGRLPPLEADGRRYLRIPLGAF
ncbi:MBL fold metallo-hydrolase [Chitinimonas koreensis]|uniref:MBL fold metallo-hydrolase n=1 Tax=Chitinimonas koreensis TaxID=356302 RepID=UPI000422A974|nr:MBL fold metallo-hydrolase [Chitinimonas koreensis]QNM95188.1 MBL fold metallo-hydrolase [Chitinimonas koreensis]